MISIVINVTSAAEALEALRELREAGELVSVKAPVLPVVSSAARLEREASKAEENAAKQAYENKFGKGFRLSKDAKRAIGEGRISYLEVIQAALSGTMPVVEESDDTTSLADYMPEDDGKDPYDA